MPKHMTARRPLDGREERQVRKLAQSAHAPADWIVHAKIIARSWDGQRTHQIAEALGCHPQTVRERVHASNAHGFDGLGMKPGGGRKPRLTQLERSTILGLVKRPPPGTPTYELNGELEVPDLPGRERVDPRHPHRHAPRPRHPDRPQPGVPYLLPRKSPLAAYAAVGDQQGSGLRPTRARIVALYTQPPPEASVLCVDEPGSVTPRNFPPAPGWSPDGHRIKVPLDDERGLDNVWVYGALCVRNGQALTQTAPARNTTGYLELLQTLDQAYPQGDLYLVAAPWPATAVGLFATGWRHIRAFSTPAFRWVPPG